ncbi:MAG: response regulator [Candidatus Hydrogenedentes bacterium]|nr:response regulator [Candidatus Hydrogenedentota bacterium]
MEMTPRLLLVEDSPEDRSLILRVLRREFPRVDAKEITNPLELQRALDNGRFEVVITDYWLGWTNGLKVLNEVRGRYPDCPVIMCTGTGNEEVAVEAMKGGLDDYVLKSPNLVMRLPAAVRLALERARQQAAVRAAEVELRRAHAQNERLLASIPSFLIGVDSDLRVTDWNAMAEKVFGLRKAEVVGKGLEDAPLSWDRNALAKQVPAWLKLTRPVRLAELRFQRADGRDGLLGITVNPILGPNNEPEGFLLLGAEITERKVLESQLVQAQKLESIGQLAAGIAHEINTPTQFVGDNTRFLQGAFHDLARLLDQYRVLWQAAKQGAVNPQLLDEIESLTKEADLEYLSEEIPKAIEQSLEGIQRVTKIVRAMKEFSHPGTEAKVPVDLNHAIESTVTVARNEWKYVAEVTMNFDPSLPLVPCLPGDFNQVVLNILINSAHAIADVVGKSGKKGQIAVSTRRDDDWAEIRISDTGTGIPETIRSRIFDPFFTTKEVGKGTGQGLAIARSVIVDKHRGTISFETEPGKGTTFIIRLPIEEVASG